MASGRLTAIKVQRETNPGRYSDGGNLYLFVRTDGRRIWTFRYKAETGRQREMALGAAADVTLAEARERARDARRLLDTGIDPIDARATAKREAVATGTTFREVAAYYVTAHEDGWKNAKHRQQWANTLNTYAHPVMGGLAINKVAVGDVLQVLEPVWREKPETASRLRGRIEAVLDYATARGWRTGDNPARWKGHLANLLPKRSKLAAVEHHAALPYCDTPAFMQRLSALPGLAAVAMRFTILTAARTGEVIGATWREIDEKARVWTVPAVRMKAGREHRVPLSPAALTVLAGLRTPDTKPADNVFPGSGKSGHLSNMSMTAVLRRMKRDDLTVHGFRSTFRDWAAETNPAPREVAEAALAHTLRDRVEAAYRRGDLLERRAKLMADWAGFLARPSITGSVVDIRGRAKVKAYRIDRG